MSGSMDWVVSAAFLSCHRPPIDESKPNPLQASSRNWRSHAKMIPVTSEYLMTLNNTTFPPSFAPRLPEMKKRKKMLSGAIS